MLLLITGASGVGKTSVRVAIEDALGAAVDGVALHHVLPSSSPVQMNREWRQRAAEAAVARAIELQAEGRHLLLAGDPCRRSRSSPRRPLRGWTRWPSVFFTRTRRRRRPVSRSGDHSGLARLPDHHAFADWMRCQATDPLHMPHVASTNGWDAMRWDRLPRVAAGWGMEIIDPSRLTRSEVARFVLGWCREALQGTVPMLHVPED